MNDQELFTYIESLIQKIITKVPIEERAGKEDLLRDHFYNIVLSAVVENLTVEDLEQLKTPDMKNKVLTDKMEEMGAMVPGLAGRIQEVLDKEVNMIETTLES